MFGRILQMIHTSTAMEIWSKSPSITASKPAKYSKASESLVFGKLNKGTLPVVMFAYLLSFLSGEGGLLLLLRLLLLRLLLLR